MNTPLTYKEQATVILFIILLIPTCLIFGAGVIPTLAIFVGIYYAKAEKDFGYLETAFKVVQYYGALIAIGMVVIVILERNLDTLFNSLHLDTLVIISSPILYLFGFNYVVVATLRRHQTWVINQGIFLNKERYGITKPSLFCFTKPTNLSVADELLKLNSLKESNLITLDEFTTLRSKLLS